VKFSSVKEAIEFLKGEIFWGVENYYLVDEDITWILTLSHEPYSIISGQKSFVQNFKKKYLKTGLRKN